MARARPTTPVRASPRLGDVVIVGAGKVGRSLARALSARGHRVRVVSARRSSVTALSSADIVVLATRDAEIRPTAARLAAHAKRGATALHVAGGRGLDELAALAEAGLHVGSAHPLLAFADPKRPPTLAGAALVIDGTPRAVAAARRLAGALEMRPVVLTGLDRTTYHAAAALLANGAAALAGAAATLLEAASVPPHRVSAMLGPLLRSVAENVQHCGPLRALTGPVRRGDAAAVVAHARAVGVRAPALLPLYRELVRAQVPLARSLGEADGAALDALLDQL